MPRFWWVNHKQTVQQERNGNYLWSPKRNQGNKRNPFYEFMREVAPGDIVFSYAFTQIGAVGVATSFAYDFPKPEEFGKAGQNWANVGWKVDVAFRELDEPLKPRAHLSQIQPLLPAKYSPLSQEGKGLQNLYLTRLTPMLGLKLQELIGNPITIDMLDLFPGQDKWIDESPPDLDAWENDIESTIVHATEIQETERQNLVRSRRGQGLFRERVLDHEPRCRVTGVDRRIHLVASHCKPWRVASNEERLDGENGLALTPSIDHLFDKGFISFENGGGLLISPVADMDALARMGVPVNQQFSAGTFSSGQKAYLDYHRELIFKESRVDK